MPIVCTPTINESGAYRSTGVDIGACSEMGGYCICWTNPGEWMKYTVNIATTGYYNIGFRVAYAVAGGVFHLEDTNGYNLTGPMNVPNTGGYETYQTITKSGVYLTAGQHVLKFVMDTPTPGGGCGNFNYMTFTSAN